LCPAHLRRVWRVGEIVIHYLLQTADAAEGGPRRFDKQFGASDGGCEKVAAFDLFDLAGCVAIVTGGAGGIGFAITEGLASAGAATVIADVLADQGRDAAARLRARELTAAFVPLDVRKRDSVH